MARTLISVVPTARQESSETLKVETVKTEIKNEIKNLDYDKFIGTLGLAADKPSGAVFPHYTAFPVNALEGNWVRVVSEVLLDDILLLKGEAWICVAPKTEENAAVWELVREGTPDPLYPTTKSVVGRIYRIFPTTLQKITPRTSTFLNFSVPVLEGAFNSEDGRKYNNRFIPLGDTVIKQVQFDFYLRVEFSPDFVGERSAFLTIYRYDPSADNIFGTFISSFLVNSSTQSPSSPLMLWRNAITVPTIPRIGTNPITYAVAAYVLHTSTIELTVTFAELTIIGRI